MKNLLLWNSFDSFYGWLVLYDFVKLHKIEGPSHLCKCVVVNRNPSWSFDWSGVYRLIVARTTIAVATAIVCDEAESFRWMTQIPLTKLSHFSGETTGTEIVLKMFQVIFSYSFFVKYLLKPSFESSTIFDSKWWSLSGDRRLRPELKYVRAGQVFAVPALFVVEHVASSDFLQTLISHLKVIDSVADDPRVAPVKANCLFNFQKGYLWLVLFVC